uniref:F-box domain-containing protein n=1 Tax=Ananas comosus var. bracteatus TaxID=296719 RepID=A0A6V7QUC9_ANACO
MAEENVTKERISREMESSDDANRINELPDCLLSIIISYLPTGEAARTSLLSSRWRHIWSTSPSTSTTPPSAVQIPPNAEDLAGAQALHRRPAMRTGGASRPSAASSPPTAAASTLSA